MRVGAVLVLSLLMASPGFTQTVLRAFIGKDGKAHIVFASRSQAIPPESQQVDCKDLAVAPDRHTVAWSVLVPNCCTSYPIPIAVVAYRNGKKIVIHPDGLMVHSWHFLERGDQIAVLFGPVHGEAVGAHLYKSSNGKVIASWDAKGTPPDWARGLKTEE